jgi:O-antigen/teichoic acid export membrane protein
MGPESKGFFLAGQYRGCKALGYFYNVERKCCFRLKNKVLTPVLTIIQRSPWELAIIDFRKISVTVWRNANRENFVQKLGMLAVANIVVAAINFIQGIWVARWVGPEVYGMAALLMSFPNLIKGVFDSRSSDATVKFAGDSLGRGDLKQALAVCKVGYAIDLLVASLTVAALVVVADYAADKIVGDASVGNLMLVYGLALIPQSLMGTSNAILATLGRFSLMSAIGIATGLIRFALVMGLLLGGWQLRGLIWANATAATVDGVVHAWIALVVARRTWGGSILTAPLKNLAGMRRQISRFLAYNDLSALINLIPSQLDVIVLGYFRGPTEVGYYKLSKSVANVVGYLNGPITAVTYPELARLWGLDSRIAFLQKVKQLALWIGLPLGSVFLIAASITPVVLPLLVGEEYLPAVLSAQLMLIGSALVLCFFWLRPVFLAQGLVQQWFYLTSPVSILFGILYPLVVFMWGYLGSALWMLTLYISATGVAGIWLWRHNKNATNTGRESLFKRGAKIRHAGH